MLAVFAWIFMAAAVGDARLQLTGEDLSKATSYRPLKDRSELDRWVLGELHATCAKVVERMDAYDNYDEEVEKRWP